MPIGKTANWLLRHDEERCGEFVHMREITRSVKVALGCLIAVVFVHVDLPYWTSQVEHLVAFTAIFSKFVLRMRRNGNFWTSGVKLDPAVRFADSDYLLE